MDEDDIKKNGVKTESIDEILRERGRLDQIIQEKFRKKMAILFSDICGFTKYMDTKGDIAGRAWVQRHHDIVLPLIERHEGKIVDIMGDGVLASFSTTLSAVKASIAIQKGLEAYNQRTDPADEIHVSMGINTGEVLVDGDNIAGDVVNVASRIESHAGKDQILVSRSAYADVRGSEDVLCRAYDSIMVKGKSEPLELYRVVWQDEDVVLSSEPRIRAREEEVEKKVKPPLRVLQLEITREEDRLKISAYEQSAGEVSTIRRYEEIPVPMEKLGVRCREVVETLNKANRRGRMTREVLVKLREIGQVFCDELFTLDVKEKVKETNADHLVLNLDDQLVHIPWELLHDGKQFLCQRFNMGRLVKTRQSVQGIRNRVLARPLRMLILADPKGDLKGAYQEGSQIRDYFDRGKDFINVLLRSDNITPDYIKEKIRNFDLVHFAGHADYNQQDPGESGWRLTSGTLQAREIIKMAGTAAMPALIFSNACQSARTEEWNLMEYFQDEIFGLANAFILAGVKHYVGTFWEILDEPSRRFALEFYKHLFSDMSIGEAIRQARMTLIKEYGEETIVWGSYLLYGDPTSNYMDQIQLIEAQDLPHRAPQRQVGEPGPPSLTVSQTDVRAREEVIDFGEKETRSKRWRWLSAALGIILLALVLLFGYPGFLKPDMTKYKNAVITYYSQGNFDEALNACNTLEDKNSKVRLAYLIRGHIYLQMGKLKEAEVAYQRALQASEGTEKERADAFIGLGRIASVRNQTDVALKYYQQATEADPASKAGYMSLGLLNREKGDYNSALKLLGRAHELEPEDHVLKAITNETREKVALARDQEKQERIDRLVAALLEGAKLPPRTLPSDGWSSPPLTMWLMDFTVQGYSLQEGESTLLVSGITDQLIQNGRVQVVERALLDRLLEELKLGASKLIDSSTALSLGKILAARLILSGQIVHSGPQTQVSFRLIETETGKISAAINESFGSAVPATILTQKLSESLLDKLTKLYPLRGKISEIKDDVITLNIGQRHGVKAGQQFRVKDTESVLEIIGVDIDSSTAKRKKGDEGLGIDFRVEAL